MSDFDIAFGFFVLLLLGFANLVLIGLADMRARSFDKKLSVLQSALADLDTSFGFLEVETSKPEPAPLCLANLVMLGHVDQRVKTLEGGLSSSQSALAALEASVGSLRSELSRPRPAAVDFGFVERFESALVEVRGQDIRLKKLETYQRAHYLALEVLKTHTGAVIWGQTNGQRL